MSRDSDLVIYTPDNLPVPDDPKLAKQLQRLQHEYVRRNIAIEASKRTAITGIGAEVELNVTGVREFARGTEGIVGIVEQAGRSEMAQVPITEYGKRRIDAMARHTEDTIERAAREIARKATDPYDTSRGRRRLSVGERLSGWTED